MSDFPSSHYYWNIFLSLSLCFLIYHVCRHQTFIVLRNTCEHSWKCSWPHFKVGSKVEKLIGNIEGPVFIQCLPLKKKSKNKFYRKVYKIFIIKIKKLLRNTKEQGNKNGKKILFLNEILGKVLARIRRHI